MLEIVTAIALSTAIAQDRYDVAYTTGKAYYYQQHLDQHVSKLEDQLPTTLKKTFAYSGTLLNLAVNQQVAMIWNF